MRVVDFWKNNYVNEHVIKYQQDGEKIVTVRNTRSIVYSALRMIFIFTLIIIHLVLHLDDVSMQRNLKMSNLLYK